MENELKGGETSAELSTDLSDDLNVITAEIKVDILRSGECVFRIGERLKIVRDNLLIYGMSGYRDWEHWCSEEFEMTRQHANRFIKVVEELGTSVFRNIKLGVAILYQIATMPEEQRGRPHTIPSTGETKTVDEMTVRELREIKKALKEAEEQRDLAKSDARLLRDTLESIEVNQPSEDARTEYVYIEKEQEDNVRTIDKASRKQFYANFIDELDYVRSKYGAVVAEGPALRESIEHDENLCIKLDNFDDFWKGFAKSVYKNQIIIEMGN